MCDGAPDEGFVRALPAVRVELGVGAGVVERSKAGGELRRELDFDPVDVGFSRALGDLHEEARAGGFARVRFGARREGGFEGERAWQAPTWNVRERRLRRRAWKGAAEVRLAVIEPFWQLVGFR